jgi:hypothetical protein
MDAIKPVFRDLAGVDILKRCLYGTTCNINERVNSVIWTRIPKTVFVRLDTHSNFGCMMQCCVLVMVYQKDCCPKHTRCEIRIKHSECCEAYRYGKDSDGRNSNAKHHERIKKNTEGYRKKKKKIKGVQMIQNMVLGSIKCESVSLFTIIFSDVKPLDKFFSELHFFHLPVPLSHEVCETEVLKFHHLLTASCLSIR